MRIRLADEICEMMGMEVRGMQPGHLIDEPDWYCSTAVNVRDERGLPCWSQLAARVASTLDRATTPTTPSRSDSGDHRATAAPRARATSAPPLAFRIDDVAVSSG